MMRDEAVVLVVVILAAYSLYAVPIALGGLAGPESAASDAVEPTRTPFEGNTSIQFDDVAAVKGLDYTGVREQPGMRGVVSNAGVFVSDYDSDGRSDLLLLGGERPALFHNDGGDFDRTDALAGLNETLQHRTALFVDYDTDGDDDLFLFPNEHPPVAFENRDGQFERTDLGFERNLSYPVSATASDVDGDGCVDLFVAQNGDWTDTRPMRLHNETFREDADNGNENRLYLGNCSTFDRASNTGLDAEHWSLSTSMADFTGDGLPDIHVANDFHPDRLYVNVGNGSFEGRSIPDTNRNGMASEVFDANRDGRFDIFVSNIYWTHEVKQTLAKIGVIVEGSLGNNLLLNQGNGTFEDAAEAYGLNRGHWGWAASAADFDNDGETDVFHTTRDQFIAAEVEDEVDSAEYQYFKESLFFERTGQTDFERRSQYAVGLEQTDGRGTARIDYNGDGALELVVANADGPFRLYENVGQTGEAVRVRVEGDGEQTELGTRVVVRTDSRTYHRLLNAKGDFLSQDSRVLHVGLADDDAVQSVRVEWPDGDVDVYRNVTAGREYTVSPNGIVAD